MNEFKFACPHCQQKIEATPEYAGVQINCPACQAQIVVPAPEAAIGPAPKSRLSKAPSPVQHVATSPVMAATTIRRAKKPRIGLYIGLGVGAVAAVAAVIITPKAINKYHEHQAQLAADKAAADAAEFARTNIPPELSADEIMNKLDSTYKDMTSYSAQGNTVGTVDMSQLMPGNPMFKDPIHTSTKLSILLGRDAHYRIEWEVQQAPKNVKGAVWSSGKGDFFRMAGAPKKLKNWETALQAADASGTMASEIALLFFHATNSLATEFKHYSKTKTESVNGHKCYVLAGEISAQGLIGNVQLWVHKDDFLIAQSQINLNGKVDDAAVSHLPAAQRAMVQKAAKMKVEFTETYSDIQTNVTLADADFQPGAAMGAKPAHKKKTEAASREDNGGGQRRSEGVAGLAPE